MSDLIRHLTSFNRKERFFLLREALGKDTFSLDEDFRTALGAKLDITIPGEAFVAMDYHLDWLQMAVYLTRTGDKRTLIPREEVLVQGQEDFNANQMDVDLLIAFDEGTKAHVVMVEAKMDTSWSNAQMGPKVARLDQVFPDPTEFDVIQPHFVLASRSKPTKLEGSSVPPWMKPRGKFTWMRLHPPEGVKITRSRASGRPSESFTHLKLRPV